MKELSIFIIIMILAFVVFIFIEASDGQISRADIINALRFDFGEKQAEEIENLDPTQGQNNNSPTSSSSPTPYQEVTPNQGNDSNDYDSYIAYDNPKESPISPYHDQIKIYTVRKERRDDPGYIKLRINTKEKINLTGFVLKTRHGEFVIPRGVEKYKSSQTKRNIIIEENFYIYIVSEKSPLRADAFRINNCFGYLAKYDEIYPKTSCSYSDIKPEKEDLYSLHPICQEYILDLGRYEIPNYSNNLSIATKSSCVKYLNDNFNYSGCYSNNNKNEDFFKNSWYIYTSSNLIEPLHDIIYLYDQNGWLVDTYSY